MSTSKRAYPKRRRGRPRTALQGAGEPKPTCVSHSERPASLPLPEAGETLPQPKPLLPEDSTIRETAIQIYTMRGAGMSEDQIAQVLGLKKSTLPGYVYKASRMGWLDAHIQSLRDRLENVTMHKVMDNLDEALTDNTRAYATGMPVKTAVALKIAEGALFPKVAAAPVQQNNLMMGIKVEIVGGEGAPKVREGTVVSSPGYIEGEIENTE